MDLSDVVHFLFGLASVLLGIQLEASIIYVAYQITQREEGGSKLRDLVEFALGLVSGALIRLWWHS